VAVQRMLRTRGLDIMMEEQEISKRDLTKLTGEVRAPLENHLPRSGGADGSADLAPDFPIFPSRTFEGGITVELANDFFCRWQAFTAVLGGGQFFNYHFFFI